MGLEGGAVDLALLWSLPGLETNEKQPHELCLPSHHSRRMWLRHGLFVCSWYQYAKTTLRLEGAAERSYFFTHNTNQKQT